MTSTSPDPLFFPAQPGRASEDVALQIEAAILAGRLAPEERLPSEREMQQQFGTGRGVIREALRALKQKGLLDIRKGVKGGAYVRKVGVVNIGESLALFLKQHHVEPLALVEFRESMDQTLTQLAIARGSREDKAALVALAEEFESCLRQEEPEADRIGLLDRDLNLALASMAANPIYEWIMHALQRGFSSHDYALYDTPQYRERTATNWADTARAIADNDPMRAQSLIGYHYAMLRTCLAGRGAEPAASPLVSPDDS
jgi:DNA-binding FadR family transcriptional regulator